MSVMAKGQQSGSAAARREQERQQRQKREKTRKSEFSNKQRFTASKRRKDRSRLYMVIGFVALFAAIIGLFVFVATRSASQTNTNPLLKTTAVDTTVLQQLIGVSPSTWGTIGTGGVTQPFQGLSGQPALKGANGHVELFYVGGEYCPYCAAQRWAMINALSRFGTFSKLSQMQSYENNISTFSFYGSTYSSQYVDFVPVEVEGNALDSTGQAYVQLQQLTADQQKTFTQYDSQQSFPFIDIGNQYTLVGSSYAPTVLLDGSQKPFTWQTIASSLSNAQSPIAKNIIGSANYITAALCKATNQQPASVCSVKAIQQIEPTVGKTAQTPGSNPLAMLSGAGLADLPHSLI